MRFIKLRITFGMTMFLAILYFCACICVDSIMGANTPVFFSGLSYLQHLIIINGVALLCFVVVMIWLIPFYILETTTRARPKGCYKSAGFYYVDKALSFVVASYLLWITVRAINKFLTYIP